MTKQEIMRNIETCINALRDVDIPSRLAGTSGKTLNNVCALLIQCGRDVAELQIAGDAKAEPEEAEEHENG